MSSKVRLLLPLLWQQPREFVDRITSIVEVKHEQYFRQAPTYERIALPQAIAHVDQARGWQLAAYMAEPACLATTHYVQEAILNLPANAPFQRTHNADFTLGQVCYALCRMLKPQVVVETGVAYGVNSTFILTALAENRAGKLYSIDLPPLGVNADEFVGTFVAAELRERWQLIRGTSRQFLPALAKAVMPIDLFIHDSLHTHRNITFELETVMPCLNRPAGIVVDDVSDNMAFADWQRRHAATNSYVIHQEQKDALFGFAILDQAAV